MFNLSAEKLCCCIFLSIIHVNIVSSQETQEISTEVGKISRQKCDEIWIGYNDNGEAVNTSGSSSENFPHLAALGFENDDEVIWGCGGSLISPKFVLTAAHCTFHTSLGFVKYVRLGVPLLQTFLEVKHYKDFNISNMYRHPEYKIPLVYNDIALLELSQAVAMPNVKPACLHTDPNLPEDQLWYAIAWGDRGDTGPYMDHLRNLNLKEYPYEMCAKAFNSNNRRRLNRGIDNRTQICAKEFGKDACPGDSGGAIHIRNPDYPFGFNIIGITSFGKPCLLITPAVFTKVPPYIEWIESIVWGEEIQDKKSKQIEK